MAINKVTKEKQAPPINPQSHIRRSKKIIFKSLVICEKREKMFSFENERALFLEGSTIEDFMTKERRIEKTPTIRLESLHPILKTRKEKRRFKK